MKLGIIVVYLVAPGNEPLLDLHLDYIDRNTDCDYTIYGSANRLTPELRTKLENHPKVNLCTIPATDLRLAEEHSYYLKKLLHTAVSDGATHLAIFHVDSFPIQTGWNRKVFDRLDEHCVLCTTSKNGDPVKPTSFLCFTRDFYLEYKPELRISEEETKSESCQRFQNQYSTVIGDSGVGYLYKAYQEKLDWCGLERMTKSGGCAIYGNMVFHLEMAHMIGQVGSKKKGPLQRNFNGLLNSIKYKILPLIPQSVLHNRNSRVRRILSKLNRQMVLADKFALEREQLFSDPESFIRQLQDGL